MKLTIDGRRISVTELGLRKGWAEEILAATTGVRWLNPSLDCLSVVALIVVAWEKQTLLGIGSRCFASTAAISTEALPPHYSDAACVMTTGGTTSGSGNHAVHSWAGLSYQSEATTNLLGWTENDVVVASLNPQHAYGYSVVRLWHDIGFHLVITSGPDPRTICSQVQRHHATALEAFPRLFGAVLRSGRSSEAMLDALRSLRHCGCGGEKLSFAVERDLEACGIEIHNGYGLTECGPNVSLSTAGIRKPGSVGRVLEGTTIQANPEGELVVRSPSGLVGWLHGERREPRDPIPTGDLGSVDDDGFVFVQGRRCFELNAGGLRVSAEAIEEPFRAVAGVRAACAVNFWDSDQGRERIALVVESSVGEERLQLASARRSLPQSLRPALVMVVHELPLTQVGKLDRRTVEAWAAGEGTGNVPTFE